VEKVQDKQQIKDVIHYLVKWESWLSEYNSYEPASHLAGAPKAIKNYKHREKHKKCKQKNNNNKNNTK